jgi:outer membrane protein OmpA-like peptidoglycan-associated protein
MKFLVYFLILVIIGMGGYGGFLYITEFKPMGEKIKGLQGENRTLTELVAKLKNRVEMSEGKKGDDSYKKSIIEGLSKISKEENFDIRRAEKGVEISLPGLRLFNPGEEKLSNEGLLLLSKLGKILKNASTGKITVEGHTDNTKISGKLTRKFPTNWELSAARSVNVVRHLEEEGGIQPERLSAVAYGEHRPIYPNDSQEHRRKNRRIVIILETPGIESGEYQKVIKKDEKVESKKEKQAEELKEKGEGKETKESKEEIERETGQSEN